MVNMGTRNRVSDPSTAKKFCATMLVTSMFCALPNCDAWNPNCMASCIMNVRIPLKKNPPTPRKTPPTT